MSLASAPGPSPLQRTLAWSVHIFTASGAVVALAALLALIAEDFRTAALLMLVALLIDSVDGTLARAARVHERVPGVDGRRLDDIVDYLNYVVVPAVFLVQAGSLAWWGVAAAPVLASAYGFSQSDAKTEDHFFLGFPSYWNVIAIYLWGLAVSPGVGTVLVLAFSVGVFVPLRYVYPSRMRVLRRTTNGAALLWLAVLAAAIAVPELDAKFQLMTISLLYPAYYLAISFWLGGFGRSKPA